MSQKMPKKRRVKFSEDSILFEYLKTNDEDSIKRTLLQNKSKIDFNWKNSNGNTILHEAVLNDWYEIVCLLIRSGANINAKNELNQTPLHLACKYGNYDIVQKLLETGANHQALNESGLKPIDLIDEHNYQLTMLVLFYMNISYGSHNFNF